MLHSSTLDHILDGNLAIRVDEAVAIVQQLLSGEASEGDAHQPYGPLALDNVEITSDGCVRCTGTAATPSVYEAAALLHALLDKAGVIPGALRYTIGRALLEVEAPPFESRQQFAEALQRFEGGPRASVIADLFARATSAPQRPSERRRVTAAAAALRRELRDADLRLYAAATASPPAVRHVTRRMQRGPVVACVLSGAALVFAGSVASTGSGSFLSGSTSTAQQRVVVARDIALLPERTSPVPAPAERASADVTAQTCEKQGLRGRRTASRPRHAPRSSAGRRAAAHAIETRCRSRCDCTYSLRVGQPISLKTSTPVYRTGCLRTALSSRDQVALPRHEQ